MEKGDRYTEISLTFEEKKMVYISSIEQIGIRQGFEQGLQEGRQEVRREVIAIILRRRFGDIDENLAKLIEQLAQTPSEEFIPPLLNLSCEELMSHFAY